MAAVLCGGIGKACSGICEVAGKILCLPCKVCGVTTDALCKVFSGDFSCYLISTAVTNAPPIYFVIKGVTADIDEGCDIGDMKTWLYVELPLCLANIVAALYIAKQIQDIKAPPAEFGGTDDAASGTIPMAHAEVVDPEKGQALPNDSPESNMDAKRSAPRKATSSETPGAGSLNRVRDVLCYDPWVAFYILLFVGFSVWQFVGIGRAAGGIGNGNCDDDVHQQIVNSFICGFVFLFVGPSIFFCSLCCATSRRNFRRN